MKHILSGIQLLSLLIAVLLFSSIYSSENKWSIRIELSKQDYTIHEPILLDVTLTNITSDTLRTYGLIQPNNSKCSVILKDSNGKQMAYTGPHFLEASGPGPLLFGSGEYDYNCFNILELYGSSDCSSGYAVSCSRFPFIPKGTYTLAVEYEGVLSNELFLKVVEPIGQEAVVLRKIEQAYQVYSRADTGPSSQLYGEIVKNYPNSVFTELCHYLSRFYSHEVFDGYSAGGGGVMRTLRREMLAEYPNSANVKGWISSLTHKKNEDERIAIYDTLIGENPDTRCSKVASLLKKRMLAKREAGE